MKKSHNSGGATQPKTGDQFTPLCRNKGFTSTMDAMSSRTRTGHPHTDKHYRYEGVVSTDQGGNVHGWSPE